MGHNFFTDPYGSESGTFRQGSGSETLLKRRFCFEYDPSEALKCTTPHRTVTKNIKHRTVPNRNAVFSVPDPKFLRKLEITILLPYQTSRIIPYRAAQKF
jgi:hypothetical protein